ncbi:MAG TPA: hypothetical protein ENF81_07130 [Thermotogaceae bacterium]|nr:hypothetical protein [Thermotogaceae bacterium]
MVSVKINVSFGNLKRNLNSVISRARNPERGLRKIAPWGLQSLQTNFKEEASGYEAVKRWAPLAESTRKERARKLGAAFAAHPILQRTKKLLNSIRYKVKTNVLTYYTQTRYAQYHVTGTHNMPARNFMIIRKHVIERMAKYIISWVFENFGK